MNNYIENGIIYEDKTKTTIVGHTKDIPNVVVIPNGVKSIEDSAFYGCKKLTEVIIPEGTTSIDDDAFCNCAELIYITIPDSITKIGSGAFFGCKNLTSINIPRHITNVSDSAFQNCAKLIDITIPDSVTSIGNSAFKGCTGLKSITIPDSVTSIGNWAFFRCSLTSVNIPPNVVSIGKEGFNGCPFLTQIIVNDKNTVYDSRNDCNAIIETATNTLITGCKNTVIPDSTTSIGDGAFRGCSDLTDIIIPNGVTNIGERAFYGCYKLKCISIPDGVKSIGYEAFRNCARLTNVAISNGITNIKSCTFASCTRLRSITIPGSVTSIGNWAFAGCTGLISITIPNSVTSIGYMSFAGCEKLTNVIIPDSVTSIEEDAFAGCNKLAQKGCFKEANKIRRKNFMKKIKLKVKSEIKSDLVKLSSLSPKDEFVIGDQVFIVLEQTSNGTRVISKEFVYRKTEFGDNSYWKLSPIRTKLNNEYFRKVADIIGQENILTMNRDLTSLDGLDDYGTCIDKISLLTAAEYAKYHKILGLNSSYPDWWYLITPYSTPSNEDSSEICFVGCGGSVDYGDCDFTCGVRPVLNLNSSILVRRTEMFATDIKQAVDETPTDDVVEVVRCKNCQYFRPYEEVEDFDGECIAHEIETDKTEFCSIGCKSKRKDVEELMNDRL